MKLPAFLGSIEKKVVASTGAAAGVGVAVAALNGAQAHPDMLGSLPTWLQSFILAVGPIVAVALSGYAAPHTERPDLAPANAATTPASTPPSTPGL